MKHFVRILVTVLILGLLGGGLWFFFFREDPDQAVFNKLTETKVRMDDEIFVESKNKIKFFGYDNILNLVNDSEFSECIGYYTVDNQFIEISSTTRLGYIRDNIFGDNGLVELNQISMDAINYYYSLSASAKDVKGGTRRDIKELIDIYNGKVDNVVRAVKDVKYFHEIKRVKTSDIAEDKDQGYKDLVNKTYLLYEAMLDKQYVQNELFFALRNYVNDYVFGTFVPDHKATAYDIYANQLEVYINELNTLRKAESGDKLKPKLIADEYTSAVKEDLLKVKENIEGFQNFTYINENAVAYLNSYKRLQKSGVLAKVIELKNADKVTLIKADYNPSSEKYISETIYNGLNLDKLKENPATYPSIKNNPTYFDNVVGAKDLLLEWVGTNAIDAVGLDNATFSNSEIKGIINGTNPSLASSFTDEVIYNTLVKLFKDKANTLDKKMAEDAAAYGIAKEYLVDAQNVLKYIYSGLKEYK